MTRRLVYIYDFVFLKKYITKTVRVRNERVDDFTDFFCCRFLVCFQARATQPPGETEKRVTHEVSRPSALSTTEEKTEQ